MLEIGRINCDIPGYGEETVKDASGVRPFIVFSKTDFRRSMRNARTIGVSVR